MSVFAGAGERDRLDWPGFLTDLVAALPCQFFPSTLKLAFIGKAALPLCLLEFSSWLQDSTQIQLLQRILLATLVPN